MDYIREHRTGKNWTFEAYIEAEYATATVTIEKEAWVSLTTNWLDINFAISRFGTFSTVSALTETINAVYWGVYAVYVCKNGDKEMFIDLHIDANSELRLRITPQGVYDCD